jgi:hypothetical protein
VTGRRVPALVAGSLLLAYVLTLAPGVTYWDSGEFLAAMKTLGIPHPPGTPLYVLTGNVWGRMLAPLFGFAYAVNLFSAACTAAACGVFAFLLHRWTRDATAAIAGGLLAGLMSSVWLNANETEVYAAALLISALLVLVADNYRVIGERRWLILLGYLLGLGWSLQLSALVAAPAALMLAYRRPALRSIPVMLIAALLGASAVFFMLVRAGHDPGINQGNPSSWASFVAVLTRAQYQPVDMLPRQAPFFIQVGNLFEYADWQVALGLTPGAPPSWSRTPFTIVYVLLGVAGSVWHRRLNRETWRVAMLLFLSATIGVVVYLNMKASPSYGFGFLPEGAKHEARERDYFFALGFAVWGLWAGAGAVRILGRISKPARLAGLAVACLPFLLNYSATDRARPAPGVAAADSANRILLPAPPRAVVFANGDNDTYPVWYAQSVEGIRTDVTSITIPLLGAPWYRAELRRRYGLLDSSSVVAWRGSRGVLDSICASARRQGRPLVVGSSGC